MPKEELMNKEDLMDIIGSNPKVDLAETNPLQDSLRELASELENLGFSTQVSTATVSLAPLVAVVGKGKSEQYNPWLSLEKI